tara:strand:+ start:5150 stop:6193 length:1044 start_codon:yes stop_codon:yes gene_type:complete
MPVQNFENLDTNTDVTTTRTLLHEVIPLTGTIISGAYSDNNIKNYPHGMYQSVFDYPYLSSSANHIFDLTVGYDETSTLSASVGSPVAQSKKINLYNQYSQVLLGYTGSTTDGVRKFENDLTLDGVGTMTNCFFINFSRLLVKDQIKKGSFSITLGRGDYDAAFTTTYTYEDISASATTETANTIGGDYGLLYRQGANNIVQGVVFYQAGIVVLSSSAFGSIPQFHPNGGGGWWTVHNTMTSASISGACDSVRRRIENVSFNNTTEINSKIYFCRVPHNKYNYSSNPTYTSGSKIRVKEVASDAPRAYITTVGLYNSQNELLATAKLSEPLMKDPSNELILRVRLDY